jgi:alpha-ketoglutarate-dependent taurine dioxygenase
MTRPGRFRGWRAENLAGSDRWIFPADPHLSDAAPPTLLAWLEPVLEELRHGSGAAWIRGLGTLEECELRGLFLRIGRGIGSVDTTYGELYDVIDSGASYLNQAIPVSQTRAATTIHTDSSRLETHPRWVGLACVRQAPVGGGSRLVSAVAVHDHLATHHPRQLERLHHRFHRDIVTPGSQPDPALIQANHFPIFSQSSDGPTLRYMRYWIEKGHERLSKPLSREDLDAFDTLDATLNDPTFRHDFPLAAGDLLFIDNHKLAHDREAYLDDPRAPRLMVRLWLNAGGPAATHPPLDGSPPDPA